MNQGMLMENDETPTIRSYKTVRAFANKFAISIGRLMLRKVAFVG